MVWTPPTFDPSREIRDHSSTEEWRRAIVDIARRHGLNATNARPFESGSDVVWGTGEHVFKLTAPEWSWQIEAEALHLAFLDKKLEFATPSPIAQGEIGGWPYIVMTRVPGVALADVWKGLARSERLRLAEALGALTNQLHRIDPAGLPETWPRFWSRCTHEVTARHAQEGVPAALLGEIDPFLERLAEVPQAPHVFLHTELLDQHVFVEERGGRFELSALIDFADSRVGPAEYDFPAVAEFIFRGEPGLMGRFLLAYGYGVEALDLAFGQRLLGWSLQHRYGRLKRILRTLDAGTRTTLPELATKLYDLSVDD